MIEKTKCLCCSSEQVFRKRILRGYQTYQCSNCFFEFVFPIPDKTEIEKHYNAINVPDDIKERIRKYVNDIENNPNNPKRDWFDYVLKTTAKLTNKTKLKILEIGSAYGYFIHYANQNGHNAIGTESTQEFASSSEGLINGKVLHLKEYDYKTITNEEKMDLIYMEHVFEHVLEPGKLLEGIKPLLSESTIVFMIVPNSRGFLSRALGSFWPWAVPPDHLYYYNKEALKNLFKKHGLKIYKSWSADYFFRSIPQFYSLVPLINIFISAAKKITGSKMKILPYQYRYPKRFSMLVLFLPYWIFYPVIKLGSAIFGYNELVVIASKENERQ